MSTKQLVREALRDFPKLRDNDKKLMLHVWRKQGFRLTREQRQAFMSVSSPDFLVRRRRECMAEFPASEEAFERRHKHYIGERERYGNLSILFKKLRRAK